MLGALYPVQVDGLYGYINESGELLIPPRFSVARDFSEGRAAVQLPGDYRFGFIDEAGGEVIPAQYTTVRDFSEGMAVVHPAIFEKSEQGARFIDQGGTLAFESKFEDAASYSDGLAAVKREGLWGAVDKTGQMVIEPRFQHAFYFREGVAKVSYPDGDGWNYIDKTGKHIFEETSTRGESLKDGLIAFDRLEKWGFMDGQGQFQIEPVYEWAQSFSEGLAAVRFQGNYGYINREGKIVFAPRLEFATAFVRGLGPVKWMGKWGYLERTGQFKIAPQFEEAGSFKTGLAQVTVGGVKKYLNENGEIVWQGESEYTLVTVDEFFAGNTRPDLRSMPGEFGAAFAQEKQEQGKQIKVNLLEGKRKKFLSPDLLRDPFVVGPAAAFALYGYFVLPWIQKLQSIIFFVPYPLTRFAPAMLSAYLGYRLGIGISRRLDPDGDWKLLKHPANILAAVALGALSYFIHGFLLDYYTVGWTAQVFAILAGGLLGLRWTPLFLRTYQRFVPEFNPRVGSVSVGRLAVTQQEELKTLRKEKPGERWISQSDLGGMLLFFFLALVAGLIFAGVYYFRIHRTVGTIQVTNELMITFLLIGTALWPFVFTFFVYIITLGRNGYALTSFGLVRLLGGKAAIFPYDLIQKSGTEFSTPPTFYYDPGSGRTSFFHSEVDRQKRAESGQPALMPYQHRSPGGSSAFLYIVVQGNSRPERIFFASGTNNMGDFRSELTKRVERGQGFSAQEIKGGAYWPLLQKFFMGIPILPLVGVLLLHYVVLPWNNKQKDEAFANRFLYKGPTRSYGKLSRKAKPLENYLRYYEEGAYVVPVKKRLLEVWLGDIADMKEKLLLSPGGRSTSKRKYRWLLQKYDSLAGVKEHKREIELLKGEGNDLSRWLKEYRPAPPPEE